MIQPGKLTTPQNNTMVPKDNTETWEYYEYPLNLYNIFNPCILTTDEEKEIFKLFPCPLLPYGITSWCLEKDIMWVDLQEHIMKIIIKFPKREEKKLLKALLNLYRCAVLKTKSDKTRGQAEVEKIMYPS